MKKKINGVLYDTATASLIAKMESLTALSGKVSTRLFKTLSGLWFQTISPITGKELTYDTNSIRINPETAITWLEKHEFTKQIREYFGSQHHDCLPERRLLIAEWKIPDSTTSNGCMKIERLHHDPKKGWTLSQTMGTALIPLNSTEAALIAKALYRPMENHLSPMNFVKPYIYEESHKQVRRETI